jgi:hypothetical protein
MMKTVPGDAAVDRRSIAISAPVSAPRKSIADSSTQSRTHPTAPGRSGTLAQLAAAINHSPRAQALVQLREKVNGSSRVQAQFALSDGAGLLAQSDRSGAESAEAQASANSSGDCGGKKKDKASQNPTPKVM